MTTTYWRMAANASTPQSYCLMWYGPLAAKETTECRPFTATYPATNTTYQKAYYAGLQACVSYAASKGFTGAITLNPRLDQHQGSLWRAWLPFNPLANYSGASYYSTVLRPHAAMAAALALAGKAKLWRLALGGEHMYTITAFPAEYSLAVQQLRQLAPGACARPCCLLLLAQLPCCRAAAAAVVGPARHAPDTRRLPAPPPRRPAARPPLHAQRALPQQLRRPIGNAEGGCAGTL